MKCPDCGSDKVQIMGACVLPIEKLPQNASSVVAFCSNCKEDKTIITDLGVEKLMKEAEEAAKLLEGAAVAKDGVYRTPDGRDFMTVLHYPFKITVEEFIEEITDPSTNRAFIENMHHLAEKGKHVPEKMYVEDWIQAYAAWMEMNE